MLRRAPLSGGTNGNFVELVSEARFLKKLSDCPTPNKGMGVFYIPAPRKLDFTDWV